MCFKERKRRKATLKREEENKAVRVWQTVYFAISVHFFPLFPSFFFSFFMNSLPLFSPWPHLANICSAHLCLADPGLHTHPHSPIPFPGSLGVIKRLTGKAPQLSFVSIDAQKKTSQCSNTCRQSVCAVLNGRWKTHATEMQICQKNI